MDIDVHSRMSSYNIQQNVYTLIWILGCKSGCGAKLATYSHCNGEHQNGDNTNGCNSSVISNGNSCGSKYR